MLLLMLCHVFMMVKFKGILSCIIYKPLVCNLRVGVLRSTD